MITEDIDANVALYVCVPPSWGRQNDFLSSSFPEEHIDELAPEPDHKGLDDPDLLRRYRAESEVAVGVIEVKSTVEPLEPVEVVEERLYQALEALTPERIVANTDRGSSSLPVKLAKAKLVAMVTAPGNVRADVPGTRSPNPTRSSGSVDRPAESGLPRSAEPAQQQSRLDVVGVGNAIVDMFVTVDHEQVREFGLELGAMTLVDDQTSERFTAATGSLRGASGGSAANTVVGVVSFGGKAGYIAHVAGDRVGNFFIEDLREAGVEFGRPAHPLTSPGTGRCLALVTPEGERTMATYLGASLLIQPEDIDADMIRRSKVVYLEGYLSDAPLGPDVLREAVRDARVAGAEVALSLSDSFCVERHYELFLELAKESDIVFANEAEARLLSREDDPDQVVAFFAELGGTAVLTLGARGSIVLSHGKREEVDVCAVDQILDRTGAGDLYAAGFLFGWTHGGDPATCGELGSLASSEVVGHLGARPEVSLRELTSRLGVRHRLHDQSWT